MATISTSTLDLTGVGAAYHRISDAKDANDLTRQRKTSSSFQERHGVTIPSAHVFEDRDWKRDEADIRPAFQQMIALAERGKVNWIVVDQSNRFGTKDQVQRLEYFIRLHKAKCRVYTSDGKQLTIKSLIGLIETGLDAQASTEELRSKAEAVIGGKTTRAEDGEWMGGHIAYGTDVVCLAAGVEQWRVVIDGRRTRVKISSNGERTRYDGEGNFPAADQRERLELRPSLDAARLDVVRRIFDWFATEAVPYSAIARRLNLAKITTAYGKAWRSAHVMNVLENPIYTGRMPYNRHSTAKYSEHVGGQRQDVADEDFGVWRKRDRADWILSRQLFDPIIDPVAFDRVQKRMTAHAKKKLPRSPEMYLSGLLYCAHCGQHMRANVRRKTLKSGRPVEHREYICSSYSANATNPKAGSCPRHAIRHDEAERYVARYLDDCGVHMQGGTIGETKETSTTPVIAAAFREYFSATTAMRRRLGNRVTGDGDLATPYRELFDADAPQHEAELAKLDAEHERITDGLMRLPATATLAIKKQQAKLVELEGQIREARTLLDNAADRAAEAFDEIQRQVREWDEAKAALNDDISARRKREHVEKVVGKIVWSFRTIAGRKRGSIEPAEVTISGADAKYQSVTWPMRCGITS